MVHALHGFSVPAHAMVLKRASKTGGHGKYLALISAIAFRFSLGMSRGPFGSSHCCGRVACDVRY